MMQFAPFIRPVILLAVICASSMLLSGCGDKLLESKETEFLLADPLENRRATEPPQHRRSADHPASSANSIQRGPLLVGAANNQTLDPVPVMRLMRVAVDLFPPVDCDKPPAWLMDSRTFDFPAQVDEGLLVDLGKPVRSVELWVVPASRDGAYIDVNIAPDSAEGRVITMEALYSGVEPELHYRTPFDTAFQFGPAWFGLPLRQVVPGRTVLFPPSQDCTSLARAQDNRLPTSVIVYGPHDQGSAPDKYIKIAADTPIAARVIEACPMKLKQRDELLEVMKGPFYKPRPKEWWSTLTVHAECEGRIVELKFDPLVNRVWE
jgi:hypothetical protein